MGQRTQVILFDDLDGSDIPAGRGETIAFEFEGEPYVIDLTKKNAAAFRKAVSPYIEASRPARASRPKPNGRSRPKAARSQAPEQEDTKAIKQWAREQGYEVAERGRIPNNVRDAFKAAHS
jgi:hypothetical protein